MGYVCPVCEDPQSDGEHLANHLAFTAMLGDADHEAWLDEHVPDWADTDPAELASRVAEDAEETEFPQVFEDTTGGAEHDHRHPDSGRGQGHSHGHGQDPLAGVVPGDVSDPSDLFDGDDAGRDPEAVIAEARELTREQWANAAAEDGEDENADGGDDSAGGGDASADGRAAGDSADDDGADGESTDAADRADDDSASDDDSAVDDDSASDDDSPDA